MTDNNENNEDLKPSSANVDCEIESKLGIKTISFKCSKELSDQLSAMAEVADMELEPFIRRLCTERNRPAEASNLQSPKERNWGDLKRLTPINNDFGFSTGQPIDRFYIDKFLEQHSADIRGCVLEIADNSYTKRFGGNRVEKSEILHFKKNAKATLTGDLASGQGIPAEAFDCIILTQTLPFIFDVRGAIENCYKALKPGGALLCTVNGISQISRFDMDRWGDFWRFTNLSLMRLLTDQFCSDLETVTITTFGNVLSATSFLMGLPAQELQLKELNHHDDDYQVLIGARAIKPAI